MQKSELTSYNLPLGNRWKQSSVKNTCHLDIDRLCEELANLRQGTLTMVEYMQKFDEVQSQIVEDPYHRVAYIWA